MCGWLTIWLLFHTFKGYFHILYIGDSSVSHLQRFFFFFFTYKCLILSSPDSKGCCCIGIFVFFVDNGVMGRREDAKMVEK